MNLPFANSTDAQVRLLFVDRTPAAGAGVTDTATDLHAALGAGGILIANVDVRAPAPETVWHLHDDDLRARYELQKVGADRRSPISATASWPT